MNNDFCGPINIGNPDEFTIKELANIIIDKINPKLNISYKFSDYNIKLTPKLLLKHLKFDKKVREKKLRFILLSDIGKVKLYTLKDEKILLDFLKKEII